MKTALIPNVQVTGSALYGRRRVWIELTEPEPPVAVCARDCTCPHHQPQTDPWSPAPLLGYRDAYVGGAR